MKLGIRSKLFLVSMGLIMGSVVVADAYLTTALDADLTERVRADMFVRLNFIARDATTFDATLDDRSAWDQLADNLGRQGEGRVTIIRRDGLVLGDSELDGTELAHVESHAERPEVLGALSGERSSSMRWSSTVKRRMIYVATPFYRASEVVGTVRLAKPLTEVDEAVGNLRHIVILASVLALILAALMSTLASHWMSKTVRSLTRAAKRMAAGDLSTRTRAVGQDELMELGRALDQLAEGLQGALGSMRTERDLMGRVLQGMREGILLLDREGHVALANPALREMLLIPAGVVGKSPIEVVRHAELKRILDEAPSATDPLAAEIELGERNPRRLLVHAAALPGEAGGVLAVFVDVTDLRRLENVRRDFVANVSHELRTPVASVKSAAETLRRTVETQPESAGDFIEIIERNAERLQRLVGDLLDLSRIESHEYRPNLEPVELDQVVRHITSQFQDRALAKQMRLVSELPVGLQPIQADRRALEQVLSNLVDNALKYGADGGSVRIRAVPNGAILRLSVEDTGPGIEAKHLRRIFERFYRVDAGRSRELGGTGLGLAIVKHLVEAMRGTVSVASEVGKGTTFIVDLPRAGA